MFQHTCVGSDRALGETIGFPYQHSTRGHVNHIIAGVEYLHGDRMSTWTGKMERDVLRAIRERRNSYLWRSIAVGVDFDSLKWNRRAVDDRQGRVKRSDSFLPVDIHLE